MCWGQWRAIWFVVIRLVVVARDEWLLLLLLLAGVGWPRVMRGMWQQ